MEILYIPDGPKNLAPLFPAIDFTQVEEYSIQLLDAGAVSIMESGKNWIHSCNDQMRIHFLNYLGTIDTINFQMLALEGDPKSTTYERPIKYPLNKPDHGIGRFNVKTNDTYTAACVDYGEDDLPWVGELLESPLAWMEKSGIQGQPDTYIPIVIQDKRYVKFLRDERYIYEVIIQFTLSHERISIRN